MHQYRVASRTTRSLCLLVAALLLGPVGHACAGQIPITKVEAMPDMPAPYELRDWKAVARRYDAYVFDATKTGEHLPLIWRTEAPDRPHASTFGLKSYVGDYRQGGNVFDVITCLGAVLGATYAGIDKSDQNGENWVAMCRAYFHPEERLYLNNIECETGHTFWYEILPNLLFYQIYDRYPDTPDMAEQFRTVADRWLTACEGMGGGADPWVLPDFDHTAFSFSKMEPVDNGRWKEADVAAAIAWLHYMALVHTGDEKYGTGVRWALEWLDQREENPYYECLLPFGAYAAARSNAEQGTAYDVSKLVNWCFDGDNWRGWGVNAARWGDYDCAGLASVTAPNEGYAFAMNTYLLAAQLAPIARYDDRFARGLGKWLLNVANASRFFYANGLPEEHQTCYQWAMTYDPDSSIAYEGLRQYAYRTEYVADDVKTPLGVRVSGDYRQTFLHDEQVQTLREEPVDDHDALEHVWRLSVTPGLRNLLVVRARRGEDGDGEGFRFSVAYAPEGPYEKAVTVDWTEDRHGWTNIKPTGSDVYLKVEDMDRTPGHADPDTLIVDYVYVDTKTYPTPYAMGDPLQRGWAETDLGLYGSSFVGLLGALVEPSNVEGILRIDLLATESFAPERYPTYLYLQPLRHAQDGSRARGRRRSRRLRRRIQPRARVRGDRKFRD